MLQEYIDALIENLSDKSIPPEIDLVIDGGGFNGGQQIGVLLYLDRLVKQRRLVIERISGCSVGAGLAASFLTGRITNLDKYANILVSGFRKNGSLSCLKDVVEHAIDWDKFADIKEGRLFVTYTDNTIGKRQTVSSYESSEDCKKKLLSSCFLPFVIDGNFETDQGYVDGIAPHLFQDKQRPCLFVSSIMGMKGMYGSILCIKGQQNIYPRIITGLDDIHKFLTSGTDNSTKLCSWLEKWTLVDVIQFRLRDLIGLVVYILGYILRMYRKYAPTVVTESAIVKEISRIIGSIFRDILFVYAY